MRSRKNTGINNLKKVRSVNLRFKFIVFIILFFVLLEVILSLLGYGHNLALFINHPEEAYQEYKVINPEIGNKYSKNLSYFQPVNDIFLKNKPDSLYRIFVMGSSAAKGFPYSNNLMFSRILGKRLESAFPDKKIEIINTAISAINSYSLKDIFPQILKEKPDAILFYAGHNEFYGPFGFGSKESVSKNQVLIQLHLKLMNLRVYQLLKNLINGKPEPSSHNLNVITNQFVNDANIIYNSELYNKGIQGFKDNLNEIHDMAEKEGVPFFISNVVTNLNAFKPLKSISTNKLEGADFYYMNGRSDESHRDFKSAYENYNKARDYDCLRYRASSDINIIIEQLALEHKVTLVPTLQLFEKKSRNNIVGNDLMVGHIYPNIQGQFLLAESFFQSLIGTKYFKQEDNDNIESFDYFVRNYGYTYFDYLFARHRIDILNDILALEDDSIQNLNNRNEYSPIALIDSLAFYSVSGNYDDLLANRSILAKKYKEKRDYSNALNEYKALVQINPYSSVNYLNVANCLLEMGDLKAALQYFEKSNAFGDNYDAHFNIGRICLIKNDIENAIKHFEIANKFVAENDKMDLFTQLYITYTRAGKSEQAKNIYDKIELIEPGKEIRIPKRIFQFNRYVPFQVQLQVDDADEYLARGNIDAAEKSLLKSIKIYDTPIANRKLGEIYLNNNEYLKSLYHLQKIYSDYKGDISYLHDLILVYLSNGKKEEAQFALEQLKKVDSHYIDIEKLQNYINDFSS